MVDVEAHSCPCGRDSDLCSSLHKNDNLHTCNFLFSILRETKQKKSIHQPPSLCVERKSSRNIGFGRRRIFRSHRQHSTLCLWIYIQVHKWTLEVYVYEYEQTNEQAKNLDQDGEKIHEAHKKRTRHTHKHTQDKKNLFSICNATK